MCRLRPALYWSQNSTNGSSSCRILSLISLIVLLSLFIQQVQTLTKEGLQPCPENPIILNARTTPQYIYSPYDENRQYPPDTDCQFLLRTSSTLHRIHVVVVESDLEEPLFTECNDYVSIRDGNHTGAKEIARWCGADYPNSISSSADGLFVHFHSDSIIQKRGFNISFAEFELPGCPPEWISKGDKPYCYKQFVLPHLLPWIEAQKECNLERANLATFLSESDYQFIIEAFSQTHSFPWIGYSDMNVEGAFESVDRAPLWPDPFPLKHENELKDCVFLDWNKREQFISYEIDDCRNRRPFICKKLKDGSTDPVVISSGSVRRGFRDSSIDFTILIVIVVVVLLFLFIISCVVYQKFKERNTRILTNDPNQSILQGSTGKLIGSRATSQTINASAPNSRLQLPVNASHPATSTQSINQTIALTTAPKARNKRDQYRKAKTGSTTITSISVKQPFQMPAPLETQLSNSSLPIHKQLEDMHRQSSYKQQTAFATNSPTPEHSPRLALSPNQPMGTSGDEWDRDQEQATETRAEATGSNLGYEPDSDEDHQKNIAEGRQRRESKVKPDEGEEIGVGGQVKEAAEEGENNHKSTTRPLDMIRGVGRVPKSTLNSLPPLSIEFQREGTLFTTQNTFTSSQFSGGTGRRLKSRRKSFDRPPNVVALDSVSAISLDEFWQK